MKWLYVIFICLLIALWVIWTKIIYPVFIGSLLEVYRAATAQKDAPTHGDAAFATEKDLRKRGLYKPGGFLACISEKGRRVYAGKEASLLLVANRGTGKTQTLIANIRSLKFRPIETETVTVGGNTIQRKRRKLPDIVMYDPKLGVLNATRDTLAELGYRVIELNIDSPASSPARYNPANYLDPKDVFDFDRQLDVMADLIAADAKHGKHSHFDNYPKIMIAGVLKYLMLTEPQNTGIPSAVERLVAGAGSRQVLFTKMGKLQDPIVRAAVDAFESAGDREKGSFITTNFEKMKVWLRPSIRAITEPRAPDGSILPTFTWEQIFDDEHPTAVFIRSGLGTGEGALVRLIIGNAINSAKRRFNERNEPLRKGLWVLIDEAVTIGRCNAVLDVNRELREAGVNLMLCFLYEGDIKATYQEDADALIGGCSWLVFGGSNDLPWYERVSKYLGRRTALGRSESESDSGTSRGRSEAGVNLMNPDQLAAMPYDECVAVLSGTKVRGRKLFKAGKKGVRFL